MRIFTGKIEYAKEIALAMMGEPVLPIFTGNSYITNDKRLVMGRGAAKEVRDNPLLLDVDKAFGVVIPHLGFYGLSVVTGSDPRISLCAAFQVKRNFRDSADLNLIALSSIMLKERAEELPNVTFKLNYPGIGNGKLNEADVATVLEEAVLPDNVHVYKYQ